MKIENGEGLTTVGMIFIYAAALGCLAVAAIVGWMVYELWARW